jgi:hypothetical protein
MYYYIILCSGYRTVSSESHLATDRHSRASRMSRMFSSLGCASLPHDQQCCLLDSTTILQNPWYDWEGASEASGLDSRWTHACVNCSRVPALIDRARVRVIETPYGGSVRGASSIYLFRHFCQNFTTSVHYRA